MKKVNHLKLQDVAFSTVVDRFLILWKKKVQVERIVACIQKRKGTGNKVELPLYASRFVKVSIYWCQLD